MSVVVVVSGPPAAGKTSLLDALADALGLPVIAKDDIKEKLFDTLGWSDEGWSKKIGAATWELLFLVAERLAAAGTAFILEANFYPDPHADRLRALVGRCGLRVVEVHCTAGAIELIRRFREREDDPQRHPGHPNPSSLPAAAVEAVRFKRRNVPLAIGEEVIVVRTDRDVDVDDVIARVRAAIR